MSETTIARLHHPYSPSKLGYLEACPHWTGQESVNTEAADAGTRQHDATEAPTDIDSPELEDHQADAVRRCKEYRDNLIALAGPGCAILKEDYLPIDGEIILDGKGNKFSGTTGGYTDLCIITADAKRADVVDWKFGAWSVAPAEENLQGYAYLLGLFFRFPTLEEITVHFVLPHQNVIDTATFKRSQFDGMLLRVKTVVARAMEATKNQAAGLWGAACPSVGACLFCGNKGQCQKLAEFTLKLGRKYNPLAIPPELTPSLMLDATYAKQSMEVAQIMEGWGKAVRGRITAKAIEDENWLPELYELRSRADTEIKDQAAFANAARAKGVPDAKIAAAMKYSATAIYKAVRDLAKTGQKENFEEIFRNENLAAGITEKEQPIYFLQRLKS